MSNNTSDNTSSSSSGSVLHVDFDEEKVLKLLVHEVATQLKVPEESIQVDQPILEIGLTSVMALKLIMHCEKLLGIKIKPVTLFKYPSITRLAKHLSNTVLNTVGLHNHELITENKAQTEDQPRIQATALYEQDSRIKIRNEAGRVHLVSTKDDIFLTGASGFLGKFLISELLNNGTGRIFCLMRGAGTANALLNQLIQSAETFGLRLKDHRERLIPVVGDLSLPKFGINALEYERIVKEVSLIIHNGARVSHLEDYDQLREENVNSLDKVFDIAALGRPKIVHFISSAVVDYRDRINGYKIQEQFPQLPESGQRVGYGDSKSVAELKIKSALALGFQSKIHRPCQLIGDSITGKIDIQRDQFLSFIVGSLQAGIFPKSNFELHLLPVDIAARLIVKVIYAHENNFDIYRVISNGIPINSIGELLKREGHAFDWVNPEDFATRMEMKCKSDNFYYIFLPYLKRNIDFMLEKIPNSDLQPINIRKLLGPKIDHDLQFREDVFMKIINQAKLPREA